MTRWEQQQQQKQQEQEQEQQQQQQRRQQQQQQHQQQQKQQQQQQQQLNYSTNRASLAAMAFYKLLGVPETATTAEIAARHRSAIKADGWMMMMDGWMMLNDSGWRKEQVDGKKER